LQPGTALGLWLVLITNNILVLWQQRPRL